MAIEFGLLVLGYLLGSIPIGYLVGLSAGIDIREHGSGSTGATNVWRCVGRSAGITVFCGDLLKGAGSILIAQYVLTQYQAPTPWAEWFIVGAGLMALVGHSRSCWIGFKGGKSVAAGFGILLALNWIVGLGAALVWGLALALWKTISLSSILAAIAAPVLMIVTGSPLAYILFATVSGAFVIWRHSSNIERLFKGTEPSIKENKESLSEAKYHSQPKQKSKPPSSTTKQPSPESGSVS
ncbi:Glycerol-3-phosphate acyltransferase [Thalassoporum mexicanum PCC 7367]|uniref:glycerol-3-phosphate 1-O-acyltransferase PlsY n=1 Tax=Thalassoporum mexicanum TaxID=3457544 RepID=UPI00029F8E14|nr:glycerol-3-phosphate 1-O-acyltransferase PlsY [Pseudanabaena sp. PCC 7367]AFY70123.1 Glycerol-3-phosphate acyltransferase [Pseudanabaena sp. PCC 7367]